LKAGKGGPDPSALAAAVASLGLPSSATACSAPADLVVCVGAVRRTGKLAVAQLQSHATTSKGVDKDRFAFRCVASAEPTTTTSITTTTGETSSTSTATTSTTIPGFVTPGAGLVASITGATISGDGQVTVTFVLTDAVGRPLTPRTASTTNPSEARVR